MADGKPNQSQDSKGEAQNVEVSADQQDTLAGNKQNVEQATHKATEGMRQGRDDSQRSRNNDVNRGDNDQKGRG